MATVFTTPPAMLNLLLSNSAHGPSKRSCCYLRAPCAHKGQTALTGLHKCRPETPGTVPPAQEEVGPKVAAVSGPSAQHARRLTQGLICMQRTQGIRQHSQVWTNADFKQLKQSLQLGGGVGGGLKREEKWGPRAAAISGPSTEHTGCLIHGLICMLCTQGSDSSHGSALMLTSNK